MDHQSPWIFQLKRKRAPLPLQGDMKTDVTVVGGGIAGISTAFFLLRETDLRVVLLEADRVAHGATGHNAGQVVSYFERPFRDLVEEYGVAMATAGLKAILSGWQLLQEMRQNAALETPLWRFQGYGGFTRIRQIIQHCRDQALFEESGLPIEPLLVAKEPGVLLQLPQDCRRYCSEVPQARVLELLETRDAAFIGAAATEKGCMNSALFTEELAGYLLSTYPERFHLAELSAVREIVVHSDSLDARTAQHGVRSRFVALCTNGFCSYTLRNGQGDLLWDPRSSVRGIVGYMAGYREGLLRNPGAIRYYTPSTHYSEPYFYLTRRPYDTESERLCLLSIGGPEVPLPPDATYHRHHSYDPEAHAALERFLRRTYRYPDPVLKFIWHGLMGYTPGDVRWIGPDPEISGILYNLGCNGVGILPSIYGGRRIAAFLKGEPLEPSIFDPKKRL